jgi:pyrrolysine biosynthesis protein PylD
LTRLRANDLRSIPSALTDYDLELLRKTGATLKQIACQAVGVDEEICQDVERYRIGVIPITAGRGILKGFTGAVQAIAKHLGFQSFITEKTDVSGLGEAFERAAHILMLADDERFLAINTTTWRVIDNAEATGKGFATALAMMEGGLKSKNILIIGVGRVGKSAARTFMRMEARLGLYDINQYLSSRVAKELLCYPSSEVIVETNLNEALLKYRIIFDASPGRGVICSRHITPQTFIAAPGIPIGLTSRARAKSLDRLLHDPLEIGVATMIMDVAYGSEEEVLS